MDSPECSLVKRRWQPEQTVADQIKEKPNRHQAQEKLEELRRADKTFALSQRQSRDLLQARGADHAVIVFGDAFAAIKSRALRTTRHGLALKMVEAPLITERFHRLRFYHSILRAAQLLLAAAVAGFGRDGTLLARPVPALPSPAR